MSIEKSPSPSTAASHKAASGSHGVKAKAVPGDAGADATGGGFMAILGALGDAQADPSAPLLAADEGLSSADGGAALVPSLFDASTLLQQNPQIAAAQALQAAAMAAAASVDAVGVTGAPSTQATQAVEGAAQQASDPLLLAQQALALGAGLPAASTPLPGQTPTDSNNKAAERPARAGLAALSSATAARTTAPDASTALDAAASPTAELQQAASQAKSGRVALQSSTDTATGASGLSVTDERADAKKFLMALEPLKAPQAEPVLTPVLAPLLAKLDKPQSERADKGIKSSEPTYGGAVLGLSVPDASQSSVPVANLAPEMQVAEQVSYWVSQNVQNAELKLDGLGQLPVEVRISMQGNEAQITFRSDEAATRDVLERAGAHLKDMLQSEGLVLTGVSVGTSGSGDARDGERQARQNVRQTAIAPLRLDPVEAGPRTRVGIASPAGRSVDLFV